MLGRRRCKLCGEEIPSDRVNYCCGDDCKYCSDMCYLTDQILPEPESTIGLFGLTKKEMTRRFRIITSPIYEAVYKVPFEEEEDQVMKDD